MSNADPKAPPPELVEKARARAVGLNLWPDSIATMASALAAFAHQHGRDEYTRGVEDAARIARDRADIVIAIRALLTAKEEKP